MCLESVLVYFYAGKAIKENFAAVFPTIIADRKFEALKNKRQGSDPCLLLKQFCKNFIFRCVPKTAPNRAYDAWRFEYLYP